MHQIIIAGEAVPMDIEEFAHRVEVYGKEDDLGMWQIVFAIQIGDQIHRAISTATAPDIEAVTEGIIILYNELKREQVIR